MSLAEERWRLVLGQYAQDQLGVSLSPTCQRIDAVMDFLYGRLYSGRGTRPDASGETDGSDAAEGRGAGNEESRLTALEWLDELRDLFPEEVCEVVELEAIDRFGLTELLADPEALDKLEPSYELMRSLLAVRRRLPNAVLAPLQRIIATVVEELLRKLQDEVRAAFSGRINRTRRGYVPDLATFDAFGTIDANLGTWDPQRRKLLVEELRFFDRSVIRFRWDVIVCIDQSGSMADSVIHSAVLAGILAKLPFIRVRLVLFDTSIVDLTEVADDPVEVLMGVQLGGGTDIAKALHYCEQLVENPERTVVALITDFHEGGSVADLVAASRRLAEARVTQLGLAALDATATPAYDRRVAELLADVGMEIAAMTPKAFGLWLSEKIG